jgi:thioredoxin 1
MEILNKSLLKEVLKDKKDSFLYFYNDSCGNCKQVTSTLEKLSETDFQYNYYKINTQSENYLAEKYNIEYVPTIILLHEGKEIRRAVGVKNFDNLK